MIISLGIFIALCAITTRTKVNIPGAVLLMAMVGDFVLACLAILNLNQ